jgi:hypothetical protein
VVLLECLQDLIIEGLVQCADEWVEGSHFDVRVRDELTQHLLSTSARRTVTSLLEHLEQFVDMSTLPKPCNGSGNRPCFSTAA